MSEQEAEENMNINTLIEKSNSVEQLEYLYSIYENQYNNANQSINNYTKTMNELLNSSLVLNKTQDIEKSNLVLNLGNSVFINTKIEKIDTVLVNIGLNYIVEKNIDEAKLFIDKKVKDYEKQIEFMNKERNEIKDVLFKMTYKLAELGAGHEEKEHTHKQGKK